MVHPMSSASSRSSDFSADPQLAQIKLPPHSLEAEQSLIGGILLDNQAWERVADLVNEADFYRDDHRRIYRHITADRPGATGGCGHRFESLEKNGEAEQAGGLATSPSSPTTRRRRRTSGATRRSSREARSCASSWRWEIEIAASALSPSGKDAKALLDEAEAKVFEIAEAGARHASGFVSIQPILKRVVDRVQELYDRDNPPRSPACRPAWSTSTRRPPACSRPT